MWQCKWHNPTFEQMQVMSSDEQILNQFATNQKMHIQIIYKSDSKKYNIEKV